MKTEVQPHDPRRREVRLAVDTRERPFLGTREGSASCFTYLLRDVSPSGVGVSRPDGLDGPEGGADLAVGERVNFHLPFRMNTSYYDQGVVRWTRRESTPAGQIAGAELDRRVPLYYPLYVKVDTGGIQFQSDGGGRAKAGDLLPLILKDAMLLKKGVRVYFGHLVPYFRRIGEVDAARYPMLKKGFLDAASEAIEANIRRLEELLASAAGGMNRFDLRAFRQAVRPELLPDEFVARYDSRAVVPFLRSIKRLEHRLYANHNAVVLLSLQCDAGF